MEKIRTLSTLIRERKRETMVTIAWALAISTIIMITFHLFHIENPLTQSTYGSPMFSDFDKLFLAVMGLVVGFFMTDVKRLVYGYFASMVTAYILSVIYIYVYIWFTLQLGLVLSTIPFGWETAVHIAIVKVFGFMFPVGIAFSFIGAVAGNTTKALLGY